MLALRLLRSCAGHLACSSFTKSALYRFDVAILNDKNIHLSQKVNLLQRLESGLPDHVNYTLILQFSLSEFFFLRFFLPCSTKWELVHFSEMSLSKFLAIAEWCTQNHSFCVNTDFWPINWLPSSLQIRLKMQLLCIKRKKFWNRKFGFTIKNFNNDHLECLRTSTHEFKIQTDLP